MTNPNSYRNYNVTLWDEGLQRLFTVKLIAGDINLAAEEAESQYNDCYLIKVEEIDD